MSKRVGILSCNIYANFTNYGSALQTFALQTAIGRQPGFEPVVMDYCPRTMLDKDILNPFKHMWDQDPVARRMCELTLPAIKENNDKFNEFYRRNFHLSARKYRPESLNYARRAEQLDGYVVGSDTVFCLEEFDLDDGYFANLPSMQGHAVSYAASFGDSHFTEESYARLNPLLRNFNALGIRENQFIPYVREQVQTEVARTIDPTLLLQAEDYDSITAPRIYERPYILMYARRYNPKMEAYVRRMAAENGWRVVEISLRATNAEEFGHTMRYDAGVEEFLSLVKHAEMVVTNSFHGMIFAVQFRRPFISFSRDQCDNKISELLALFGITDRLFVDGTEPEPAPVDYAAVHNRIGAERVRSLEFLNRALHTL